MSKLTDRLIEWAQNHERIDNNYTDHGKDCLEAAKLLWAHEVIEYIKKWENLDD